METSSNFLKDNFVLYYYVFVCLQELYIGNNQIDRLETEQLSSLAAVSLLELRDNKIKSLPEQITLLNTLTRLDLTNNNVSTYVIR